ncbi:MAG: hypothetical protein QXH27_01155 [Candidatus Micrarchaeia archaeon]
MAVEIPTKYWAFGCMGAGLMALLVGFTNSGTSAALAAIGAGFFFFLSFAFYKWGYILVPLITTGSRVVEVHEGGYEIPPTQDAVLREIKGIYYASKFLLVRIYESMTEKSEEEKAQYTEFFERAITSVKYVTKFCMLVYVKDLTKYREQIETKRMEAQLRLSREMEKPEPDVLKVDRYEREKGMWDAMLQRLMSGVRPMGSVCYVMTTATGVTKDAALAAARAQANELRATIANALNVEVVPLTGEDMKRCFDWEFTLPPTVKELEEQIS